MRREAFKFGDLVRLILETLRYIDSTLRVTSQRSNQFCQRVRPASKRLAGRLGCHTAINIKLIGLDFYLFQLTDPGRCGCSFKYVIFKHIVVIDILSISEATWLDWWKVNIGSLNGFVQSHYPSYCWPNPCHITPGTMMTLAAADVINHNGRKIGRFKPIRFCYARMTSAQSWSRRHHWFEPTSSLPIFKGLYLVIYKTLVLIFPIQLKEC